MSKKTLILDFDKVIFDSKALYNDPRAIVGEPVKGALDALLLYSEKFEVHIVTSRMSADKAAKVSMASWMSVKFTEELVKRNVQPHEAKTLVDRLISLLKFTSGPKPVAIAEISANAVRFDGTFPSVEAILQSDIWK